MKQPLQGCCSNFQLHMHEKKKLRQQKLNAATTKQKITGQPHKGNSSRMGESSKLANRGMEVRTSERERRREGGLKKRKGTPLSLYYLSVIGLLRSYYGYRDSRLSVLLTIANKGSIQCWATMQIPTLSLPLSVSFFIHSVSIQVHRSLQICTFPLEYPLFPLSPKLHSELPIFPPSTPTTVPLFDVLVLPLIPLFF